MKRSSLNDNPRAVSAAMALILFPIAVAFVTLGQLPNTPFLGVRPNASGVTDWSTRVVANGGAQPSAATVAAMEAFRLGVISDGISNKMLSVCIFVPDSLIAATTPIFKALGNDPWVNHNFDTTNLTVEGLKGDGSTKYLDTGVIANGGNAVNSGTGNCGLAVVISESNSNLNDVVMGHIAAASATPLLLQVSGLVNSVPGVTAFLTRSTTLTETASTVDYDRVGYVSGNSVLSNLTIYVANPLMLHRTNAAQAAVTTLAAASGTDTIFAFANANATTAESFTGKRISVAAITDGLTVAESSNFWSRLYTLRTALGGGTGDPVDNWATKVVRFGGAAPSVGTKAALRTFYSGLDSAGILTKMVAVNPYVPDNLTAARTPLIWRAGSESWTNYFFAATNLSVNGLTGDGIAKFLGTGIIPANLEAVSNPANTNTGFSVTSAGISLMVVTNSGTGYDFGAFAVGQFALITSVTTIFYYCWHYTGPNTDYVAAPAPSPGATWAGFLSGNRTAATAIALYRANTGTTFGTLTNATGTQTSTLSQYTRSALAFALGSNVTEGAPVAATYSPHTISYLSLHSGFTSVQASNEYFLVAEMRTDLTGGNP